MQALGRWFTDVDWLFRHFLLLALLGVAAAAWFFWQARRLDRAGWRRWATGGLATLALLGTATGVWLVNGPLQCVKNAYVRIGQKPTNFAFQLVSSDTERHLKDYRGKIVVVNLLPASSLPQRAQQAALDQLNLQYGPKGLVVIALSDVEPGLLRRHFTEQPASFVEGRLAAQHARQPLLQGLERGRPITFILDRSGVVRASILGERSYDELEKRLTTYL